jgi:hypothetical protein
MKKFIVYSSILFLLSSCATIMNRKTTKIEIHSFPDSAILMLTPDSMVITPVILQVPRSYNDFKLELKKDSMHKELFFKSKIAPQVWGNFVFLFYSPIGIIVDVYSKTKIFTYRKDLLVDFKVQPAKIRQWYPDNKGKFFLIVKIPGLNYLKLDTGLKTANFNMLSGIILGADYYYGRRNFLSTEFGFTGAINPDHPVLGRINPDTVEKATSFIFKINNNHDFKYASIGYGINLSDYLYSKSITDSLGNYSTPRKTNDYLAIGCNANITFRLFQFLTLGFTYAPAFFNLSACKYEYSHVIYLDVGIRLQLKKSRNERIKVIKYVPRYLEDRNR